jgi:hypothetical protein
LSATKATSAFYHKRGFLVCGYLRSIELMGRAHLFSGAPVVEAAAKMLALKVDEFNLLMKQINYDQTVFDNLQ